MHQQQRWGPWKLWSPCYHLVKSAGPAPLSAQSPWSYLNDQMQSWIHPLSTCIQGWCCTGGRSAERSQSNPGPHGGTMPLHKLCPVRLTNIWNRLSPLFQPAINPILSHMEWSATQLILDDCIYPPMKVTLRVWEALLSWVNQILHNHLALSITKPGLLRIELKSTLCPLMRSWGGFRDIEAASSLTYREDVIAQQCLLICCQRTLELHFLCIWSFSFDYCCCLCA